MASGMAQHGLALRQRGWPMSTRLLLTGLLTSAAVRRKRRADGAVFAVARIRDTDRGSSRIWTAFASDLDVIEQLEEMRIGEPIAVAGPFAIVVSGNRHEARIEHRITAEALLDTKRRRKSKEQIAKEARVESDEFDQAPFNDDLPEIMHQSVNTVAACGPAE